jgi:hypothetical protein
MCPTGVTPAVRRHPITYTIWIAQRLPLSVPGIVLFLLLHSYFSFLLPYRVPKGDVITALREIENRERFDFWGS